MKQKEYFGQLRAMLIKNGKLHIRHIRRAIAEVVVPLLIMGMSSLMVYAVLSLTSVFESGYGKRYITIITNLNKNYKHFHILLLA